MYYGDEGAYHHGGFAPNKQNSASYLIQWEAIKEAKRWNMSAYNFWVS